MCGISGIIDFKQAVDSKLVARMNSVLSHRGPDGEGLWADENAALGHRRLKILDLTDHAAQPMVSRDKNLIMIFNGEIYNFKDLRTQLGESPSWRSTGDSEVLLRAFEKWGAACLSKLNGMFAFAIWNIKEKTLFAARDRYGIKPFYYSLKNGRFIFASEIKGILAAGVPREPNYFKIGEFLRWGALDYSEDTWFQGIQSLMPGEYIFLRKNEFRKDKYYWLPDQIDENNPVGMKEGIDRFRELLSDSLRLQLQSDRKVGVHLSGGVDSTVVTAMVSHLYPDTISTYTFGYEETLFDERPFAKNVAQTLGVSNDTSMLSDKDIPDWLPRALSEEDEPFTSFRQLSHHKLYADFEKKGSTVILEASGGDEIGAGYSSYLWSWYLDNLKERGPSKAAKELLSFSESIGMKGPQLINFLLGSAANYEQAGLCTSDGIPYLDPDVLEPDFVDHYGQRKPVYPKPFRSNLRNSQFIDLLYAKLPRGLRYIERASMATGREARLPLLDHRLVELGFSFENSAKISDGHLRRFMKEAVLSLLPPSLLNANKRSVADPQKAWLKGPLVEWVKDIFNSKIFADRGLIKSQRALESYEDFRKADLSVNSLGIFQMLIVEMWFRVLIDHVPEALVTR
ncbi:MAG: asparagine synthase (glutamine-hydrolyzing) [Elusimicrobia bacterium]|nr:asparagine synthase (glutamine-hydrolyzing) [Candidatus Obscuribacterium magneticum]